VQTLLLEQFELTHARGSSHGTGRIFRISYPEAPYVRLTRRALGAWRSLEEAAGEPLVVTTGGLDAGPVAEDCARALGGVRGGLRVALAGRRGGALPRDVGRRAPTRP